MSRFVFRPLIAAVLALVVASAVSGQGAKAPWTVDAIVQQDSVSGYALAPDGTRAVWITKAIDKKKDAYIGHVHLLDLASGKKRQVLFGPDGESDIRWSPDGKRLVFVSARKPPARADDDDASSASSKDEEDEKAQAWILNLDGGEPFPATKFKEGVSGVRWIDPATLLVAARERKSFREVRDEDAKDTTRVVEDSAHFQEEAVRLFKVKVEDDGPSGDVERLTTNPDLVSSFEVAPDGTAVVYARTVSPTYEADERHPPRIFVRVIADGRETELFAGKKNRPTSFVWRPDSKGFYALMPVSSVDGESTAAITTVVHVEARSLATIEVPLGWDRGIAAGGLVATNDGFLALLRQGVTQRLARYTGKDSGWTHEGVSGTHTARIHEIVKAAGADTVLYVTGSASDPDRVCKARLAEASLVEEAEVFRPNGGFEKRVIAPASVIRWRGALGEEVEGILFSPPDAGQERRPLIVMPHGGPFAADVDRFDENYAYAPNLYTQRGARVLMPNYHGSEGYGLAFGESIKGRYYEHEVIDILSGVDQLVKTGLADPAALGILGWSNGAILTIATVTMADVFAPEYSYRFKACAPGAGDVNWTSDYGNCAFGAVFDDFYLGGPPWKIPEVYVRKSPLFHAEKNTTPTLIFFGDKDTAVPTSQGWEWYRALQQIGKAPVRFLLFPGEPHGIRKPSFRRRKLVEELAWFDRHLFGRPEVPIAMKHDAPLAAALAARTYAREGGVLGKLEKGVLVPELVGWRGLLVGRFEVTRAQWRAVYQDVHLGPGESDFPITGVSSEQALDYVRRLSERMGMTIRLLSEDELETLPEGARENTLDAWVGYAPPPDAVAAVRALAADLASESAIPPLLERVDARPPGVGKDGAGVVRIHGAGGNAAEWVSDKEGKPVIRGGSAFTTEDPGEKEPVIPVAYAGLRIAAVLPSK